MIATHSQYIVQSAMNKANRDDVKIILLKNQIQELKQRQ